MEELDLKRAYEILGLPENATRDEVEKKYDLLLRREVARSRGGKKESSEFDEINRAYRTIIDFEGQKVVEKINEEKYGKYKQHADKVAKLDHFFSYYRWHLISAIVLVAFIIYGISAYIDHQEEQARLAALPPQDLEVSIIGQFALPQDAEIETLEEAVLAQFPGWQRVEADLQYLNMSPGAATDVAMQEKAFLTLVTEVPDLYILDQYTFLWVAQSGALMNLDSIVEERFAGLLPDGSAMTAPEREAVLDADPDTPIDQLPHHIYGIDLTSSPLVKELPLGMREVIVAIRGNAERPEKALEFIEQYLKAMQ